MGTSNSRKSTVLSWSMALFAALPFGCVQPSPELPGDDPASIESDNNATADTNSDASADSNANSTTGEDASGGLDADSTLIATFQQGVNGYDGAKAVAISTLYADAWNDYNGTTFTDAVDWCIGDLPYEGYDESILMRFENLELPEGAVVTEATLTCTFDSRYSDQSVIGRYLLVPWSTEPGTNGSGVGWKYRDAGIPWSALGARGPGVDFDEGRSFEFTGITSAGWQTIATALDVETVKRWIDEPSSNFGVVLLVDIPNRHTGFRQPQNDNIADRPILKVRYTINQ